MIKYYLQEMFEPTLLYGISLSILGVSASIYYKHFSLFLAILVIVGSVLAQMSVNVISDYFDYTSGLDKELARRKSDQLSGGSSLIAGGHIKPRRTLLLGTTIFLLASIIGIYLLYVRVEILPIIIIASLSIFLYARYVKKVPYLSEPACTFNYIMISLGSFVVLSGAAALNYSLIFSFIPAGIMLGGNALFVNEVPDRAIDKKYGIKHSAVMLKTSKRIGAYYLGWQVIAYILLGLGIMLRKLPIFSVLSFFSLPITFYVFKGLYNADSKRYGEYLSAHTLSSFVLALALALSYLLGV